MCINEEAAARPLIGDVVTALTYLANHSYDLGGVPTAPRAAGSWGEEEVGGGGSGSRWGDSSPATARRELDRERAVAEAKMWGENWREKRRAGNPPDG